jgi:putative Mg2+ transporter-C (MgtC) family protein
MHLTNFIARILIALILGTAVGLERQWHQRTAGLRTNALVSVGSALFASLAGLMINESSPTRMAAQIVSGIGFLGAGLILREGNHVRGLNTAATVWCSAAVGTLCGSGFFYQAIIGTIAILAANVILRPLSLKMAAKAANDLSDLETTYSLKIVCSQTAEQHARALLMNAVLRTASTLRSLHSESSKDSDQLTVIAQVMTPGRQDAIMETIVSELGIDDKVKSVSWEAQPVDPAKE